ncbi:helix-turn-helix domain-containing protein [Gemmatimonadota bacterium]
MPKLALLQPDPRERARIGAALGDEFALVHCKGWKRLQRVLREQGPDGAIIDLYGTPGGVPLASIQRLRRKHPSLALIVYSEFTAREMDLYVLGRMSVDGVIRAEEVKGARDFKDRVTQALASGLASTVQDALHTRVPTLVLDSLTWAVEHAHRAPRVNDLANAQGFTPRSLSRDLVGLGGPSPGQILLWGRLIRAAKLLEDPERTVESAAHSLGYSTGAALRKAFGHSADVSPARITEEGGVALVMEAFTDSRAPLTPPWQPQHGERRNVDERRITNRRGRL